MKKAFAVFAMIVFSSIQFSCGAKDGAAAGAKAPDLTTQSAKMSYMLGLDIGNSLKELKELNIPLDTGVLFSAIRDVMSGRTPLLADSAMMPLKQEFMKMMQEGQMKKMSEMSAKNLKEGQAFLDENKKKATVKTTASGLQYEVVAEGKGPSPKPTDRVKVNYEGKLLDGKIFDSSIKRGQPAEFQVSGVIPGWTEGLQLMKAGSKYKFYIPGNLAYGERGAGRDIGPNQLLIFDVELLSIDNTPPAKQPNIQGMLQGSRPQMAKPANQPK
jgi:FKBP-type peptidyl-prolyl cis-trans isomerase FkpA